MQRQGLGIEGRKQVLVHFHVDRSRQSRDLLDESCLV